MNALRKGRCPGALAPMRSGDGLIVRLRLSCGELSWAHAREIAALASLCGNGEIDLTARAHLQIRGVDDAAYPALIERLAEAGLVDASPEAEAVRNVLVAPLAGFDGPFDVRPFARAWERALAASPELWRLPGKFGVAFDAGRLPLGDDSDIRFEAQLDETFVALLAGAAEALGPFPASDAVAVARALTGAFLALAEVAEGPRRLRDAMRLHGLAPFAAAAALPRVAAPSPPRSAGWLGAQNLAGGWFVGVAAPFGRLHASQLAALVEPSGAPGLRLTPWRALLIPGLDEPQARALGAQARGLGLIVDADDPVLRVAACAGAPACSSALGETREAARRLAPLAPSGEGIWLHVSGCAKGCAHPRPAPLTAVATREGYQLNGEAARTLDALAENIAGIAA
jgi:precorrin-3B synthase